jgi:hypothetical protein
MRIDRLYENLSLWIPPLDECAGKYNIPIIKATTMPYVDSWVHPSRLTCRAIDGTMGLHMYSYDYQIERLWGQPQKYMDILRKAGCVCTPDYSLYVDTPLALNLYNHYRKHWLGAYWQSNGVRVIPTICWSDNASFDWCFDGEPSQGVVSVSSIGTQRQADTKAAFMRGYDAMLERLQPDTILFFGKVPAECRGNICPIEAFYEEVKGRRKA